MTTRVTPCHNQTNNTAPSSEIVETNNGIPDNTVNKGTQRRQKSSTAQDKLKTPEKKKSKRNKKTKETGAEERNISKAVFEENDEFVTMELEGQDEFLEDGELSQSSQSDTEDFDDEVQFVKLSDEAKKLQREQDEKEADQFKKQIAGETFAMVKQMMEDSGLLDAATIIKQQFSKEKGKETEKSSPPIQENDNSSKKREKCSM